MGNHVSVFPPIAINFEISLNYVCVQIETVTNLKLHSCEAKCYKEPLP